MIHLSALKAAFITLGCKANQFETQAMELILSEKGFDIVNPDDTADVYVINSCAVTATAGKKSRQSMRQARKRNPLALIAACGCYSVMDGGKLISDGLADIVGGNRDHREFVGRIVAHLAAAPIPKVENTVGFEFLPAGSLLGHTRALLKIQDGCRNFCSYCIIPYLRGELRSMPPDDAVREAARLAHDGYREIVLTGIEIAAYGQDFAEKPTLPSLIRDICTAAPTARFRLGSLEPRIIDEQFCIATKALPNLCHHFHLSLQSGSASVLARMGRRYSPNRYMEAVQLLRKEFPFCSITTDVIVGFPGETDAEFMECDAFCRAVGFERLHIFPYSRRTGTRAADMPNQLPLSVKTSRAAILQETASELALNALFARVGRCETVLFETGSSDFAEGYTGSYLPVRVKSMHAMTGELHLVRLTAVDAHGGFLAGELE